MLNGCASLPSQPAQRGLYIDARKALNSESRLGWTIDRVEIEDAIAQTEPSACVVDKAQRDGLRTWVAVQLAKAGGPPEAQFRAGKPKSELDDAMDLEHTAKLLDGLELHLPEDCPFWLEPEPDFEGTHTATHRVVLIAESMGGASLLFREGEVRAAGGGAARVLGSYGITPTFQIAAGVEAGGDAVLERSENGNLVPEGAFRFGAPAWFRYVNVDRIYDVELAVITRLDHGSIQPWGGRLALAGGVTGLRRLGFMPALQLWLGYEVFPAQDGGAAQHSLRIGTRVGFDWDP